MTIDDLKRELRRIDGRGYPAYKSLRGSWTFDGFTLEIRHVQGDPYARPSRLAARVPAAHAGFPDWARRTRSRRTALACFLARAFIEAGPEDRTPDHPRRGHIAMVDPGQVVLPQTAVTVDEGGALEARFTLGLPASGRRVLGSEAERLLTDVLPARINASLVARAHEPRGLATHVEANEDADAMRAQLAPRGLIAFVANGAILPRRSGVDNRPLSGDAAVPFQSPPTLEVSLDRPNGGPVAGMGIPEGVTLLVGGGYHGKSTLLDAVALGVYNHRPGDGREWVVTDDTAAKIQAEDGRSVTGVDISPFIGTLPGGTDTTSFTTRNASGSTSQAAAIMEAVEAGCRLLLIDEDTAASNFMVRDRRMQLLVPRDREPITPFVDRVRRLHGELGVSTLIVIGGSGDYLDVADRVVGMVDYRPMDLTERARTVALEVPTGRHPEAAPAAWPSRYRRVDPASVDARRGRHDRHIRVPERSVLQFGSERVDLRGLPQLVSAAQARAVALALVCMASRSDGTEPVERVLEMLTELLRAEGLDALDAHRTGELALPRSHEIAAVLNRLRGIRLVEGPA